MSEIGKQIKKYRMEKQLTQEQLGQLLNVTTQAVSKWERGGTPDADMLPCLSEALGVSIDALFGREEQSVTMSLARQLCRMPSEKAFRYAYELCWAIEIGLIHDADFLDKVLSKFLDYSEIADDEYDYFSKIMLDSGMTTMRLSRDMHYFFIMEEPESGIRSQIADPETLRSVFSVFADKRMLRIIFYMYSRNNTPLDTSLISKNTGIECKEVDRCMETLCKNRLATRTPIDTAGGEINTYLFRQESSVLPLLCFADEIAKKEDEVRDFFIDFSRRKPLL